MRLRNWLLTGTSIGLMALLPLRVRAQDGDARRRVPGLSWPQQRPAMPPPPRPRWHADRACIVAGYASIESASPPSPPAAPPAEARRLPPTLLQTLRLLPQPKPQPLLRPRLPQTLKPRR